MCATRLDQSPESPQIKIPVAPNNRKCGFVAEKGKLKVRLEFYTEKKIPAIFHVKGKEDLSLGGKYAR